MQSVFPFQDQIFKYRSFSCIETKTKKGQVQGQHVIRHSYSFGTVVINS